MTYHVSICIWKNLRRRNFCTLLAIIFLSYLTIEFCCSLIGWWPSNLHIWIQNFLIGLTSISSVSEVWVILYESYELKRPFSYCCLRNDFHYDVACPYFAVTNNFLNDSWLMTYKNNYGGHFFNSIKFSDWKISE